MKEKGASLEGTFLKVRQEEGPMLVDSSFQSFEVIIEKALSPIRKVLEGNKKGLTKRYRLG